MISSYLGLTGLELTRVLGLQFRCTTVVVADASRANTDLKWQSTFGSIEAMVSNAWRFFHERLPAQTARELKVSS